ncbi:hypothetical protein EJB05_53870, partial [Eragrostis curvula]
MWGEVVSRLARPAESPAAAIAAVIGDDDLLREILLRVGFPSTLVRAALVSRRWLHQASDRAFLRRFRDRHPPRLLGYYINDLGGPRQRFVPVSRAPELAAAVRLAAVAAGHFYVFHSQNGRLRVNEYGETLMDDRLAVLNPLHPARGTVFLPPSPPEHTRIWFFLAGDDGAAAVGIFSIGTKLQVDLLTLRSGAWVVHRTAVLDHPETLPDISRILPPARGKIYMLSHPFHYDTLQHVLTHTYPVHIIRLDIATANVSVIPLPDTVRTTNYKLSLGDQEEEDSGLSLVYAEGYLLSVWRLATNTNDWVLVYDRIQVREACHRLEDVKVRAVDDTCEFVFLWLEASAVVICMHLESRTEKVEKLRGCLAELLPLLLLLLLT